MSNEKNEEVIGIIVAVALLIALTVTAGTVIYGAFGGYGSFYEMFCASVRNVLIAWAIAQQIHGGFPNLGLRFPLRGHTARLRNPLLGDLQPVQRH
jgi:hypothetical protein